MIFKILDHLNTKKLVLKTLRIDSALGKLILFEDNEALVGLQFSTEEVADSNTPLLLEARKQLLEYFDKKRTKFEIPLAPIGSEFQLRVWEELREVPYGSTVSYGQLAQKLGDHKAIRAVGSANARNPIPIIIPCHRVVGKDGSMIGFSGGVDKKIALLEHEGALLAFGE